MTPTSLRPRPWRAAALLITCVLLAACQPPWARTGSTPTPQPSPAPTLEAADAAFFGNHYTLAEKQYQAYVRAHPGSGPGHAHYALFLNYARRFGDAAAQSDAAVALAPKDGYVLAVATRVKDWAAPLASNPQDAIVAAQAQGAAAVRAAPQLALTHIFYSETLADNGNFAQASEHLALAESLAGGSVYDRAEIERERANMAQDQGDKTAQLQHLLAARTRQPSWAERTRELAEYYFANDQADQAVIEFRRAIDLAPDDATLRVALGDVALQRQDMTLADEAFAGANRLQPHVAATEASLAVAEFNLHRDTTAAEKLLRAATNDSPRDLHLAMLLEGFLRYIKRDVAAANAVAQAAPGNEDPPRLRGGAQDLDQLRVADATKALAAVNAARAATHLPPAHLDPVIQQSATAHAYWWIFNLGLPQTHDLGIHREVGSTPGFTGVTMRDRATTFGYHSASMAEDITHRGDPTAAVGDWVDSVFHRFPIMRADLDGVGFGEAEVDILPIEVMDMSYTDATGDPRSMHPYPADTQLEVPLAFFGNELPDPVPAGGSYPTGYPVTLNFNVFSRVVVSSWSITGAQGQALDAYVIKPGPASENVLSLLPKKPFDPGARYTVRVSGTIDGAAFTTTWSFTTRAPTTQA